MLPHPLIYVQIDHINFGYPKDKLKLAQIQNLYYDCTLHPFIYLFLLNKKRESPVRAH